MSAALKELLVTDGFHALPELEMYQPRYVLCTPTTTYAADSLLGLIWAVVSGDWLWQGPSRP